MNILKKEPRLIGTMVILLSKNSGRILPLICQCPSASTKRSNNAWIDVSSFLWVPNGNRYWSQKVVFDAAVVSLLTYMHYCMRNIVENSGDCFLVCGVGIERNFGK